MNFHRPFKLCLLSSSSLSSSTGNFLDRIIVCSLRHNQQLKFCTVSKKRVRTVVGPETIKKEGSRIARLLRIGKEQGKQIFVAKSYIAKVKDENILQNLKILEKFKVPASYYTKTCPELLCAKPKCLESDIVICNEVGINIFHNFEEEEHKCINRYRKLNCSTVAVLKSRGFIPYDHDVTKKLVDLLEMDAEAVEKLYDFLPMRHDSLDLKSLRYHIITYHLSSVLNCSIRDAQIVQNRYASSEYRSFEVTRDILNILKNKFLFTSKMILSSDAIFKSHPADLLELYDTVKTLSGQPAGDIFKARPKVILQKPSALLEIQKLILEDYGYPLEALQRRPEIYTLCARTIKKRLEEMETVPQFKSLKSHPASIAILYYFNKCKKRLQEINASRTPLVFPSLHILTTGSDNYQKFLGSGLKPHGKDLIVVLSKYFKDKKQSEIRHYIAVHPHWIDVPLSEVEAVLNYLSSFEEISKDSLFEALPLVLYPIEKVKDCIHSTLEKGEATLKDTYFLQMVLYFLEKSVHFTGDGIWRGGGLAQMRLDDQNPSSEFDFIFNETDRDTSDENPENED